MTIDASKLKFYKSLYWSDGNNGGEIDTSSPLSGASLNLIFSTANMNFDGSTYSRLKKIYLMNENDDPFSASHLYFPTSILSQYASIQFATAGWLAQTDQDVVACATAQVANGSCFISTPFDLRGYIECGDAVYNSTDDTSDNALQVVDITEDTITLVSKYQGTSNSSCNLTVAMFNPNLAIWKYASQYSDLAALSFSPIAKNQYRGIWLKNTFTRSITATATNSFSIAWENATTSTNIFTNGDFEDGDFTGWSTTSGYGGIPSVTASSKHDGSYGCVLDTTDNHTNFTRWATISQSVDFTGVSEMTFWYKIYYATTTYLEMEGNWHFRVYISGDPVYEQFSPDWDNSTSWHYITVDTTKYSGICETTFESYSVDTVA